MLLYLEYLNFWNCFFQLIPFVLRQKGKVKIFVIDATWIGLQCAKKIIRRLGGSIEILSFRMIDIRDEKGLLIRLRLEFDDLGEVVQDIWETGRLDSVLKNPEFSAGFLTHLRKAIADPYSWSSRTLWRALLIIQVAVWHRKNKDLQGDAVFFLEKRPFMQSIIKYGNKNGLTIFPLLWRRRLSFKESAKNSRWAKKIYQKTKSIYGNLEMRRLEKSRGGPLLAVECYDFFNLDCKEFHSDFFFWQESGLAGKDIVTLFNVPHNPLDEAKQKALLQEGIQSVVLNPNATKIPKTLYGPRKKMREHIRSGFLKKLECNRLEKKWIGNSLRQYNEKFFYLRELFDEKNIKVYLTWFRYGGSHGILADAVRAAGGIFAVYQRALDTKPSISLLTEADVAFGYSKFSAQVEEDSGSKIPYYVVTGYFGDHRYPLLKPKADLLRQKMMGHGAKKIIAYSDEGSADDPRWHTGHIYVRENYAFLLEKVLTQNWFGLVLKPKNPATLRRRLGPVAKMLDEALATGRAYVYEGGVSHGFHPPAIAALCADIAIHGYLCGPTAGLECALAGVPTLLMDREGWHISPLYQLGEGKVVFKNWEFLWETCLQHWKRPVEGFGDWSSMLDLLDPFRDGRGAHRVGTYLQGLIEGFKEGWPREKVLEVVAQRYAQTWGYDKIIGFQRKIKAA